MLIHMVNLHPEFRHFLWIRVWQCRLNDDEITATGSIVIAAVIKISPLSYLLIAQR